MTSACADETLGARLAERSRDRRTLVEGAFTAPVLRAAAQAAGVDMPVCAAVPALLEGGCAR